jgi:hypothetical protein
MVCFKTYKNKRNGQLTMVLSKKKIELLKAQKVKYLKIKLEELK